MVRRWSLVTGGIVLVIVLLLVASMLLGILWAYGSNAVEQVVDSVIVGPGDADYLFDLVGGYSLVRSGPDRHSVDRPSGHGALPGDRGKPMTPVIDWDVTRLGWNDRFIVCFQSFNRDSDRATGWWIIDTLDHSRLGPMNEEVYIEKLQALSISQITVHSVESYDRTGVQDGG